MKRKGRRKRSHGYHQMRAPVAKATHQARANAVQAETRRARAVRKEMHHTPLLLARRCLSVASRGGFSEETSV